MNNSNTDGNLVNFWSICYRFTVIYSPTTPKTWLIAPSSQSWFNSDTSCCFLHFCRSQRGSDLCLKSGGGLQREERVMSRHHGEKSCTDSNYLHHLWKDYLFMRRSQYTEITYIATYKEKTLRKLLHNHRCHIRFLLRPAFVTWSATSA